MSTGKKPKGTPGEKKVPHSTYFEVRNGCADCGYKAGEVHGVIGHYIDTHKPCLFEYTDGELQCKYCACDVEKIWRGYIALWDRDWMLRYALICQEHLESVDQIQVGLMVKLTRHKNPISPLVIRAEPCLERQLPGKPPYNQPVDTELLCLRLWQDAALEEWVRQKRLKTNTTLPKGVAVDKDNRPFAPGTQAAAKRAGAKVTTEKAANDALDATLEKLKRRAAVLGAVPSTNGKHDAT